MADEKVRREFTIYFRDGSQRSGVLYSEGNIMMVDSELFARLDHLINDDVVSVEFARRD